MERLQKVIAESGITSRRKAEELITSGQVKVNGIVVTTLGTKVSSDDVVTVNGKKIRKEQKEYYLLNKPRNVVCTLSDEFNRKLITDYIDTPARIFPVGRLDYDTTGLIILTNDGELANKLTHPKNKVPKTYLAKINGSMDMAIYHELKNGIMIDNIKVVPERLKIKSRDLEKNTSLIEITIIEGRNHIVKRIFESLGYDVLKLTREKYAFLTIGKLRSGEYRFLSDEEIKKLNEY